jgi:hypothetical protein
VSRDNRYLEGLAGRMMLDTYGVTTALLSGGLVTEGSSKALINITAAKGLCNFDVTVTDDDEAWAVPAVSKTDQIIQTARSTAQTDFSLSTATLDGSTPNYVKLRYKEITAQTRTRTNAAGTYAYSVEESFEIVVNATAPTVYDVVLATLVGNGSSTLTITQRYPIGPAGQQMALCAMYGAPYDGSDAFLGEKLSIASSKPIGAIISSPIELTPTTWTGSRSSTNPTGAQYFPAIPLHDANHDITTNEVPQSVITALNANKVVVKNGAGANVSSFTATLASGVLTFASNTENNNFLAMLQEAGMVNRWYGTGEIGLWAAGGALWTGARQYSVTIGGTNYAITALSTASRTITLATYPADGTVTVECFPTRIAGSTTSARLRRVSGEVMQAGGDISSEVGVGLARMHRVLHHGHDFDMQYSTTTGGTSDGWTIGTKAAGTITLTSRAPSQIMITGNSSLVSGKTNDVRSFGVGVYLHLGTLLATTWTSAA